VRCTKQKTYLYRERDEAARQAFLEIIQEYKPEEIVYVDEAGVDNTESYAYGWCHHTQRFKADKLGHRTSRICMIAGWCDRQIVAPMTFEGYCDTSLVELWVEQMLVPALRPQQVVVIDNASFHKSAAIQEMIEGADCKLLFLPSYSPDLNKIEKFWARLKNQLRKTMHQFEDFWDAVDHAFTLLS
jgi:transposase